MKCLTICQPWASAILLCGKNIENRTWATSYRGPVLIHAGVSPKWIVEARHSPQARLMRELEPFEKLPRGQIIGVATLYAVHQGESDFLAGSWGGFEGFHWYLKDARAFAEPIPWKGQLGLFEVPDEIVRGVLAA